MSRGDDEPPHPRATLDLVGHAAAEQAMLAAWTSGRMPHAWLIAGPAGIGKATLAYRFARFVLANGRPSPLLGPPADLGLPAGHPVAARVLAGGHGDLIALERQWDARKKRLRTEIVIDQVRPIRQFFHGTAAEEGWRIAIVDPAEDLNENAQNALLKVLEEPPEDSLLLLVSHAPGRLLPTIRSRCRVLRLQPLGDAEVRRVLVRQCPELPAEEVRPLALLAEGSPGRAVELAGQGGAAIYRELLALLAKLPELDVAKLHELADKLARSGAEDAYRVWLDMLLLWLTRMVRAAATGEGGEAAAGEGALGARLTGRGNLDRWVELWEKIADLATRAERVYLDRKQVVLGAFAAVEDVARG